MTFLAGVASGAQPASTEEWVGTWSAAPQPFMPGALETFRNQSVRLIVRTSIGGQQLRLRLSNAYGDAPVVLGAVHVALAQADGEIDATTDRAVTFMGRDAAAIAPRGVAVSDAITLETPAFANLAVTLFFPNETPAATSHFLALKTGYVAADAGDFTGAAKFPVGKKIDTWPFLTGVDVLGSPDASAVVVFGDSTVDGDGSTANSDHRWTDALAKRFAESGSPLNRVAVLNAGIVGNRLLADSPREPPSEFGDALGRAGVRRFVHDALEQPGVTHVIVRIGVNDVAFPGTFVADPKPVSAKALIAGYRRLIAQAHARRVRIILTTITPFEGATTAEGFYTPAKEAVRQEVNTWLRKAPDVDGLIDLDKVLRDPSRRTRLLPKYDSGDHLHPSDDGYAACAEAVPLALFTHK